MAKVNRGGKRLQGGTYYKHKRNLKYGDEFETVAEFSDLNVKVIVNKIKDEAASPQDTATPNRIYALPLDNNPNNPLKSFVFYDEQGRKYKQIDRDEHIINEKKVKPHTHYGYYHNENGDDYVSKEDLKLIEEIEKRWYNYINRK